MEYSQITYSVADSIATITLDRPEQMNAFTDRMMHELIDAFDQVDADDDARGDRHRCGGTGILRRR